MKLCTDATCSSHEGAHGAKQSPGNGAKRYRFRIRGIERDRGDLNTRVPGKENLKFRMVARLSMLLRCIGVHGVDHEP